MKNDIIVNVLGKNYNIKCPPDQIDDLHNAVTHLNDRISQLEANANKKIINNINKENLMVIATLNVINELLCEHKSIKKEIDNLTKLLETAFS